MKRIVLIFILFVLSVPNVCALSMISIDVLIMDDEMNQSVDNVEEFSLDTETNKLAVFKDYDYSSDVVIEVVGIRYEGSIIFVDLNMDLVENSKIVESQLTSITNGDICYFSRYQLRMVNFIDDGDGLATFIIERRPEFEYLVSQFLFKVFVEPFTVG